MARLRWPVARSERYTAWSICTVGGRHRSENLPSNRFKRSIHGFCAIDQCGCGDGAGIDHRVKRPVGAFVEDNRIKRFAAGFHAHFAEDMVDADDLQAQSRKQTVSRSTAS